MKYVALLRGVNVGGKNTIAMKDLSVCLEGAGFSGVKTFLNSGNVLFESEITDKNLIAAQIEKLLITNFQFDSSLIKVLVLSSKDLAQIVEEAPKGFGTQPENYHTDVVFFINETSKNSLELFDLNPAVDSVWEGNGVVYFQRLSALRTKSRLSKVMAKPIYKSLTIRTWNTTTKLLKLINS